MTNNFIKVTCFCRCFTLIVEHFLCDLTVRLLFVSSRQVAPRSGQPFSTSEICVTASRIYIFLTVPLTSAMTITRILTGQLVINSSSFFQTSFSMSYKANCSRAIFKIEDYLGHFFESVLVAFLMLKNVVPFCTSNQNSSVQFFSISSAELLLPITLSAPMAFHNFAEWNRIESYIYNIDFFDLFRCGLSP